MVKIKVFLSNPNANLVILGHHHILDDVCALLFFAYQLQHSLAHSAILQRKVQPPALRIANVLDGRSEVRLFGPQTWYKIAPESFVRS